MERSVIISEKEYYQFLEYEKIALAKAHELISCIYERNWATAGNYPELRVFNETETIKNIRLEMEEYKK